MVFQLSFVIVHTRSVICACKRGKQKTQGQGKSSRVAMFNVTSKLENDQPDKSFIIYFSIGKNMVNYLWRVIMAQICAKLLLFLVFVGFFILFPLFLLLLLLCFYISYAYRHTDWLLTRTSDGIVLDLHTHPQAKLYRIHMISIKYEIPRISVQCDWYSKY